MPEEEKKKKDPKKEKEKKKKGEGDKPEEEEEEDSELEGIKARLKGDLIGKINNDLVIREDEEVAKEGKQKPGQ